MIRILMFHQHDPTGDYVAGIGSFINAFIKFSPADFEINFVGVSGRTKENSIGTWRKIKMGQKEFNFLPVIKANPAERKFIPLSLRFTKAVSNHRSRMDLKGAILTFHRIEPELSFRKLSNPKILFAHAHPSDLHHPKAEMRWGRFPWLYFWLEKKLIKDFNRIFTVREDAVGFYRNHYPDIGERISFIPTFVDETIFFPASEDLRSKWREERVNTYQLNPKSKIILSVGRFEGQKDPHLLLEAFDRLIREREEVSLVLIGAGSLEASLRDFIERKNLSTKVRLLAPMAQAGIAQWMNLADCLCLSSAFEGMPMAVIEALRCGLPVVSTRVGEVSRLIFPSTGKLVESRDPVALSQALKDLLRRPVDRAACQKRAEPYWASKVLNPIYRSYRKLSVPE